MGFGYDYADRPYSAQHQATLSAVQLQSLSRKGGPADTTVSTPEPTIPQRAAVGRPQPIGIRQGAAAQSVTLRTFTPATYKAPSAFVASRSMAARPPARRRLAALAAPSADVFVAATTYAPFGPVTAIAYGNGTQQNLTYSTRYFPTDNQLVSPANVVLADHGYVEDAVGNITTLSDNLDPGYNEKPYDSLDSCCMVHDRDHCHCHASECGGFRENLCKAVADVALGSCASHVNAVKDHFGYHDEIELEFAAQVPITTGMSTFISRQAVRRYPVA